MIMSRSSESLQQTHQVSQSLWGQIITTHTLSSLLSVPTAHLHA